MSENETSRSVAEDRGGVAVPDSMIDAYLKANDDYWRQMDSLTAAPCEWRAGTAREATRISLEAALATTPQASATPPHPASHDSAKVDTLFDALANYSRALEGVEGVIDTGENDEHTELGRCEDRLHDAIAEMGYVRAPGAAATQAKAAQSAQACGAGVARAQGAVEAVAEIVDGPVPESRALKIRGVVVASWALRSYKEPMYQRKCDEINAAAHTTPAPAAVQEPEAGK